MDIFKLIAIGIIGAIVCALLKKTDSQYSALIAVATGIIILIICVKSLAEVIISLQEIVDKTGINSSLFAILLKIVGIGYLTEYSCSLCNDLDCASIGQKISFAGKIAIFLMSLPIVNSLVDIIVGLL